MRKYLILVFILICSFNPRSIWAASRPMVGMDVSGFVTLSGQRFLPMMIYASTGQQQFLEDAADAGLNSVWYVDNINYGNGVLDRAQALGLLGHPDGYGESVGSFRCDVTLPQTNDPAHPECSVCDMVGKLCPSGCNYCNPDYVTAFVNQKKGQLCHQIF